MSIEEIPNNTVVYIYYSIHKIHWVGGGYNIVITSLNYWGTLFPEPMADLVP